jgi:hypothetical protein
MLALQNYFARPLRIRGCRWLSRRAFRGSESVAFVPKPLHDRVDAFSQPRTVLRPTPQTNRRRERRINGNQSILAILPNEGKKFTIVKGYGAWRTGSDKNHSSPPTVAAQQSNAGILTFATPQIHADEGIE